LVPDEQVALHRAVAAALEMRPELGVDLDRAAELAQHWDSAEQPRPALLWSVRAAEHAAARYAVESAVGFYERALRWRDAVDEDDAPTCARLLNAYTAYLLEDGRAVAALELTPRLLVAVDAAGDDLLQADAYQVVAQCYEGVNDSAQMLGASDRAIEIARTRG